VDVTWLGHSCFRLRGRNASVVCDPYPPALGGRLPKLEASLVTVSHDHENHSHIAAVVNRDAYVVNGPGEYEVAGVSVLGLPTFHDASEGARHGRNTAYVVEIDEVRTCHLGDLGHQLGDRTLEAMGNVHVLMVPVGGGAALDAAQAAEVVRQIDPRIVIPMHFARPGVLSHLEPVDRFLKEMGMDEAVPQPKLSIQGPPGDGETKVIVLEPRV
jgi:L-ascorbate metabolism protein UlaG (beta-lactamase superfamily)